MAQIESVDFAKANQKCALPPNSQEELVSSVSRSVEYEFEVRVSSEVFPGAKMLQTEVCAASDFPDQMKRVGIIKACGYCPVCTRSIKVRRAD